MKVGDKVEHVLSKDWLLVLDIDDKYVLCRTKDLRQIAFHKFELKEIK